MTTNFLSLFDALLVLFFETGSHCIALDGLKHRILLQILNYKHALPYPTDPSNSPEVGQSTHLEPPSISFSSETQICIPFQLTDIQGACDLVTKASGEPCVKAQARPGAQPL